LAAADAMQRRLKAALLACALAWSCGLLTDPAEAQNKVRTETIRPPAVPAKPDAGDAASTPRIAPPHAQKPSTTPDIITDLAELPAPVARTRERILTAARSGDLRKLLAVMQSNETLPIFSFSDDRDPIAYWRANYPDSEGVELLSILVTILETGFVHADKGTPQEMYLWPYFARMPVANLTAAQKVELFRIITGNDYKEMLDFGAYIFYRLGIGPDGTWHFFVAGG
jgi:hypothetical protein